jgi:hypothetical protein
MSMFGEDIDAEFAKLMEDAGFPARPKRAPRHHAKETPMPEKASLKDGWSSLPAPIRKQISESLGAAGFGLLATLVLAPRRFQQVGKLFGKDLRYRDGLSIYFALVYAGWAVANGANSVKQSQKRADELKATLAKLK